MIIECVEAGIVCVESTLECSDVTDGGDGIGAFVVSIADMDPVRDPPQPGTSYDGTWSFQQAREWRGYCHTHSKTCTFFISDGSLGTFTRVWNGGWTVFGEFSYKGAIDLAVTDGDCFGGSLWFESGLQGAIFVEGSFS